MVRRRTSRRKKRTVYPPLGAAPSRKSNAWVIVILGALVFVNLYVFVWDKKTSVAAIKEQAQKAPVALTMPPAPLPPAPLPPQPATSGNPAAPAQAPVGPPGAIDGVVGKS